MTKDKVTDVDNYIKSFPVATQKNYNRYVLLLKKPYPKQLR